MVQCVDAWFLKCHLYGNVPGKYKIIK